VYITVLECVLDTLLCMSFIRSQQDSKADLSFYSL